MLQSAREWKSTPGEAQKFGLQQHPAKQNKTKTKKSSYWRLDDENEDDGDDDDTVWMMTTMMKTIGTLRSNDADDNENVKKKTIGLIGKKLLRRCTTLFCTFLSRFCTTTT